MFEAIGQFFKSMLAMGLFWIVFIGIPIIVLYVLYGIAILID
jgi:hypothetical protein